MRPPPKRIKTRMAQVFGDSALCTFRLEHEPSCADRNFEPFSTSNLLNAAVYGVLFTRFLPYFGCDAVQVSWKDLQSSMEVLRQFHLLLVLDFVDDELWALDEALGWDAARKQVTVMSCKRVLRARGV